MKATSSAQASAGNCPSETFGAPDDAAAGSVSPSTRRISSSTAASIPPA
ncbi:Uncharacterised protein [Acinetobacter baumannii]|nr:Uncharacterised protein [Acinetobacter baumannii]